MKASNLIGFIVVVSIFIAICSASTKKSKPVEKHIEEDPIEHILIDSVTTATVYNATTKQCNSNPSKPANPHFTIDLNHPGAHRILAMERTMRIKYGLNYGDIVYIEGTDYDGYWQIQDTMNKRFRGKSRIDLLMDYNITKGKWKNVKVYKVICSEKQEQEIRSEFLASL